MLVLSRKQGQTITISGGIRVVVVAIMGDKVRLGFIAPDDVQIARDDCKNTEPKERKPCEQ